MEMVGFFNHLAPPDWPEMLRKLKNRKDNSRRGRVERLELTEPARVKGAKDLAMWLTADGGSPGTTTV
jgi:hypothetical protein